MRQEVRITGGEFGGQKIRTPGGMTHPMGERERLALFNRLGTDIEGRYVVDLYAGSGAIGIEALSRGAAFVAFFDNSPEAVETINKNLRKLGVNPFRGRAMPLDLPVVLRTATDRYELVIADPPYDKFEEKYYKYLGRIVLEGGMLVLSHPGEAPEIRGLNLVDTRKYAGASISFYQKPLK